MLHPHSDIEDNPQSINQPKADAKAFNIKHIYENLDEFIYYYIRSDAIERF